MWSYLSSELALSPRTLSRRHARGCWRATTRGRAVRSSTAQAARMQIELGTPSEFLAFSGVVGRGWNINLPRSLETKSSRKKVAQSKQVFACVIPPFADGSKRKREGAEPGLRLTYDPTASIMTVKMWWVKRKVEELDSTGALDF